MFRAKGFFVHNRPEFPKRAVVTAGMPYGNKGLHCGHIAGVFVPADVYARFLRDRIGAGNVLFVSGTDCFGSPINEGYRKLVEAGDFDGTIADYVQMNHDVQKAALDAYDISLDIFEGSGIGLSGVKQQEMTDDFITRLYDNGWLEKLSTPQFYDAQAGTFLNGRQVLGRCPVQGCKSEKAYADECDLGHQYDPVDLIAPKSALTGQTPEMREVSNWYFELPRFHDLIAAHIEQVAGMCGTRRVLVDEVESFLAPPIIYIQEKFADDFSAIEARVIAWIAGEHWRQDVFANGGDIYCASASQMFHVPVEKHGVNGHLRQKGKIAELALGYGGSVGALKAMGALNYGLQEEELKPLVDAWRLSNPHITKFWWDVDKAASTCVRERTATETHGIRFYYQSGMMFVVLPSGRRLVYVKPKMGLNRFGNESVTYEGVGEQKKWLRLESYGPKFVENIVQATARDILAEAMLRLNAAGYRIVMHVHDEAVIEAPPDTSLENICSVMGQTPTWASGLLLRADGYVCDFYKKD